MKTTLPTLALGLLLSASTASAAVYSLGHADFGIGYDGGFELHHHVHNGSTVNGSAIVGDAEFAPGDLTVLVPFITENRPAGAQYDFLGVSAGIPVWTLPEIENVNKPFYGVGSEELDALDFTGDLTLQLLSVVSAPSGGDFSLWQDNGGSPIVRFATSNGVDGSDSFLVTPGGHEHYNWSFTKAGTYELQFRVSGVHGVDGFDDDIQTYTFQVVPEPSKAIFAGLGLGFVFFRRRRPANS
ncbi:MAG: choice-of-anchor M domain-containing protein [Verrucomicrobiaceae bacterium]|nr:choice-of-anchor M domain-containing protein [Verrucomicrobiaceae bacterium]